MENQHRKIKGYRELSQDEIDLINQIKQKGVELSNLLDSLDEHIEGQFEPFSNGELERSDKYTEGPHDLSSDTELERLTAAQPKRWLNIARTHFQEGCMAATRSIAQPEFF